jgi:hypothetical protein
MSDYNATVRQAFERAVSAAIAQMGQTVFKQTSFFLRAEARRVATDKAAA